MEEKWIVRYEAAKDRMFVVAEGHATDDNTRRAAERFTELLGKRTTDMVCDIDKMTGYTTGARRAWQDALYPVRGQIRRMVMVGSNLPTMVRMGATVVAAFIGVPIRFFRSFDELEDEERRR